MPAPGHFKAFRLIPNPAQRQCVTQFKIGPRDGLFIAAQFRGHINDIERRVQAAHAGQAQRQAARQWPATRVSRAEC